MGLRSAALLLLGALALVAGNRITDAIKSKRRPRSKPHVRDEAAGAQSKYRQRPGMTLEDVVFATDASDHHHADPRCPLSVRHVWTAETASSLYATPLIYPLLRENSKQIVVPAFAHDVEVINSDGSRPMGWPVSFEGSMFHSSPALHDIDKDGVQDVLVVDSDGRILWLEADEEGRFAAEHELLVPRLAVRKDWHEGLDDSFVEASISLSEFVHRHEPRAGKQSSGDDRRARGEEEEDDEDDDDDDEEEEEEGDAQESRGPAAGAPSDRPVVSMVDEAESSPSTDPGANAGGPKGPTSDRVQRGRRGRAARDSVGIGVEDRRKRPASRRLLQARESFDEVRGDAAADDSALPQRRPPPERVPGEGPVREGHVLVDAHVLANPVVADIDGDGHHELIVAVSYFFDREQYPDPEQWEQQLGKGVNPAKYVAGSIVCYDVDEEKWRWTVHLDLTTDETAYRAYIHSPPVVADLEGDGSMEIIVGTSLGLVYVLDARGETREGFPVQVGEVQGHVAVGDLTGDGALEMVAADMRGNVVVINGAGETVWDRHLPGSLPQGATLGDVDGDGSVDVVVATTAGAVYALRGDDGSTLPHFPVRVGDKVLSPVTLVSLHNHTAPGSAEDAVRGGAAGPRRRHGLHLVFPAFDGHLYIVDGADGCTNKVDVGEHSYAMVLADDVTGDGFLDLLVSTMSGSVHLFGTDAPYHPANTWTSPGQGRSTYQARPGWQSVAITPQTRQYRETFGPSLRLEVEVQDHRRGVDPVQREYRLAVGTSSDRVLLTMRVTRPGVYPVTLHFPSPGPVTVLATMVNEHGQYFEDAAAFSAYSHFYRLMKWLLVLPRIAAFLLTGGIILARTRKGSLLPQRGRAE